MSAAEHVRWDACLSRSFVCCVALCYAGCFVAQIQAQIQARELALQSADDELDEDAQGAMHNNEQLVSF